MRTGAGTDASSLVLPPKDGGSFPLAMPGSDACRSPWLHARPLLRCIAIYGQMPVAFSVCLILFVVVNGGLAAQQHLLGRAVQDLESGLAVVKLSDGTLDMRVGLRWVAVVVAVAAVRSVLQYGAGSLSLFVGQELVFRLRILILEQVLRLDIAYHALHGAGEMITRTTRDVEKVREALVGACRNVIEAALVGLGAIFLVVWYAPLLAVGPTVAVVVGVVQLLRHTDAIVNLDRSVGAAYDAVNQNVSEGVRGVRVIKAFGLEASRIALFEAAIETFAASARRALRFATRHIPLPQVIVAAGHVWVVVVGTWLVAEGRLDVGALVAALLMMNTLVFRVEAAGPIMRVFADARSSAARIMELLDAQPRIVSGSRALPPGPLGITLEDVGVGTTTPGRGILSQCSLSVAPGEIVALVGATGSGKSMLTALLPRMVDADQGRVCVGSTEAGWHDVKELDLAALRRRVHVVPQDVFLFSDSIAANLRMGAPRATDEELWRALRLAGAEDIVAGLPEGMATILGDRGLTLSGGQRQRLTLARALVGRPSVLVLDDATSALDAVTERKILDAIRRLSAEGQLVTILLVASKLSSVLLADRAVLLVGGRIVAQGTHEELTRDYPVYRELLGVGDGRA